jgi:hypothetical protein
MNRHQSIDQVHRPDYAIKIVGTQLPKEQKSPLGVLSLAKNRTNTLQDLVGRVLAVPAANTLTVEAVLHERNR